MSRKVARNLPSRPSRAAAPDFLAARPIRNASMSVDWRADGTALAEIPVRRPRWLVPPLSWILPFSSRRRTELDAIGSTVLRMCDGKRTVENIIEEFARTERLSFREAQLPVTQFLGQLLQRGIVAIVGREKDAGS